MTKVQLSKSQKLDFWSTLVIMSQLIPTDFSYLKILLIFKIKTICLIVYEWLKIDLLAQIICQCCNFMNLYVLKFIMRKMQSCIIIYVSLFFYSFNLKMILFLDIYYLVVPLEAELAQLNNMKNGKKVSIMFFFIKKKANWF